MKKLLLSAISLLISLPVLSQDISYSDYSKYLLDNEVLRSPVYTKRVYRSIREYDEGLYQNRLSELEKQKEDRVISTREYSQQKEQIENAYKTAYGKQNNEQLGAAISQYPAAAFYSSLSVSPNRMPLLKKAEIFDTEVTTTVPAAQQQTQKPQFERPAAPIAPPNRRRIPTMAPAIQESTSKLDTSSKSISIRSLHPNKKRLGEKSIPINISTFK